MTTESQNKVQGLNVLVVDDKVNIRKTLTVCLESRGHRVTAVNNGKDAQVESDR